MFAPVVVELTWWCGRPPPSRVLWCVVDRDVMCGRPPRRKGEVNVRRSVECSHVFGLLLQRSRLLALMKSADRLPNHVNALEALW